MTTITSRSARNILSIKTNASFYQRAIVKDEYNNVIDVFGNGQGRDLFSETNAIGKTWNIEAYNKANINDQWIASKIKVTSNSYGGHDAGADDAGNDGDYDDLVVSIIPI